jgi:hypothetical protein
MTDPTPMTAEERARWMAEVEMQLAAVVPPLTGWMADLTTALRLLREQEREIAFFKNQNDVLWNRLRQAALKREEPR